MSDELTLLQKEGIRINRAKEIREALADELSEVLTEDETAHLRAGQMSEMLAVQIASLRLFMRGRR